MSPWPSPVRERVAPFPGHRKKNSSTQCESGSEPNRFCDGRHMSVPTERCIMTDQPKNSTAEGEAQHPRAGAEAGAGVRDAGRVRIRPASPSKEDWFKKMLDDINAQDAPTKSPD